MNTKRAAIYARTSTEDQDSDGKLSMSMQVDKCQAYADLHDFEVVEVYREKFSGTASLTRRPEGAKFVALARAGKVDAIIFTKLDRFSRSTKQALNDFDLLAELGAETVFVEDNLDTTTPMGRAMRDLMLTFATLERETILTRMGSVRYGLSQMGVFPGSPIPFGYFLAEDRKTFLVNEDEAATVRRAYELRLEGLSMVEVAKRLTAEGHRTRARNFTDKATGETTAERRPWRMSRITKLIAEERYKGSPYTLSVRVDPLDPDSRESFSWAMPELVSATDWAKANVRRAGRPKNAGMRMNVYALPSVFHDHGDGDLVSMFRSTRTSTWKGNKKHERQYLCKEGRTNTETGEPPSCAGFGYVQRDTITTRAKADRVEALALHYMLGLIQNPETLASLRDDAEERRSTVDLDAETARLEKHREGVLRRRGFVVEQGADDSEAGIHDPVAYAKRLAKVDVDLAEVDVDLAAIKAERDGVESERRSIEDLILDIVQVDEFASYEDLRAWELDEDRRSDPVTFSTAGKSSANPPERLSRRWVVLLLDEVQAALTRNNRGATPPLSAWAVEETKHLAKRLGLVVVLKRNDEGKNAASWPTVSIGLNLDRLTRLGSVPDVRFSDPPWLRRNSRGGRGVGRGT